MFKKNILLIGIFIIGVLIVFRNWFSNTVLSSGDWIYYFPKTIEQISPLAAWDSRHFGLGSSVLPTLWLEAYSSTTVKLALLIGWGAYERIFWYFPFLIFSCFSAYFLYKKIFPDSSNTILAPVIFLFNTYSLMLVGGGQMGIGLAYSFTPFVVLGLINLIKNMSVKNSLILGLLLSALVVFDLRILYIFLVISVFIVLFLVDWIPFRIKDIIQKLLLIYVIPGIITVLIHSFWILPLILSRQNPVSQFSEIYSSTGAVKFFSFAFLENTLSLLHPNWPENLFGKVYFMRIEFLLFPILAFSSLLFVGKDTYKKRVICCFTVMGLVGVFLAKGANDPFGGIYLWLFNHIPGFVLFRDPTKWYQLIIVSYLVLIPFSLEAISQVLAKRIKVKRTPIIITCCFILYFFFTIRFAFWGTLSKTFHPHVIPDEYIELSHFIENQHTDFKTLWVPMIQTYGYFSEDNPSISSNDFFHVSSASASIQKISASKETLALAGIKYVIVPYDVNGEIFLDDRKYDEKQYKQAINDMAKIPWLRRIDGFEKIAVFENSVFFPLFSFENNTSKIFITRHSPYSFTIKSDNVQKGERIIFAETFNNNWIKKDDNTEHSVPYKKMFNSFTVNKNGAFTAEILYTPQQYVWIGAVISVITMLVVIGMITLNRRKT